MKCDISMSSKWAFFFVSTGSEFRRSASTQMSFRISMVSSIEPKNAELNQRFMEKCDFFKKQIGSNLTAIKHFHHKPDQMGFRFEKTEVRSKQTEEIGHFRSP